MVFTGPVDRRKSAKTPIMVENKAELTCCGVSLLIIFVGLIAGSFGYVAELQYCLKYHSITRNLEKLETEKGTHFIGIAQNYKCFPSQRLALEFSPPNYNEDDPDADEELDMDEYENGEMPKLGLLHSRTSEGLDIGMDILVEYELRPEENSLMALFDLVGTNFTFWYKDIVTASLMNTASLFEAQKFLGVTRTAIQERMLENLQARQRDITARIGALGLHFGELDEKAITMPTQFFMKVLDIQLRHVDLPNDYEALIAAIEAVKLDKRMAHKESELAKKVEAEEREKQMWAIEKDRVEKIIAEQAKVEGAAVARDGSLLAADTEAKINVKKAERERVLMEIDTAMDLAVMQGARIEQETKKETEKVEAEKQFARERIDADAAAQKTVTEAEARLYAAQKAADAEASATKAVKTAELGEYKMYRDETSNKMNVTSYLQHAWQSALQKLNNAKMYLDYEKVPLFVDGRSEL